jgi:hypothetical protein
MRMSLAALMATVAVIPASAAEFEVKDDRLLFKGTIEANDRDRFAEFINPIDKHLTVVLYSRGGVTAPSLGIGRLIRQRG